MLCLQVDSDPEWVSRALANLDRVLVDHAHCEMKAASNALALAARHPLDTDLVMALTDLAREEIDHFQQVLVRLKARGLSLGPPPVDAYAAELRKAAGALKTELTPLADRLVVCAIIEARSCERFKILAAALGTAGEPDLAAFYATLLAAEARHFTTFVDLAVHANGFAREPVLSRLAALAAREGTIVRALASGSLVRPPGVDLDRATVHG